MGLNFDSLHSIFFNFRASPGEVKDTTFTVKGLTEGRPYEFRVAAVNDAGVGAFEETSAAITPKAPEGSNIIYKIQTPFGAYQIKLENY